MKRDREFIEFEKDTFINISKLEEMLITKEDLEKYSKQCINLANGNYFNLKYLKKLGFESDLDDLGFEDMFYESIIQFTKGVKTVNFANTKVFKYTNDPFSRSIFLEDIISRYKKISSSDLLDLLKNDYGIETDLSNIKYLLQNSSVYFNEIMDEFYQNYQLFFEEV